MHCRFAVIFLESFLIDEILFIGFDSGVKDRHHAEAVSPQIGDQLFGILESRGMPSENAIAVHVINVEVNHIARNLALAKFFSQFANLRVAFVSPATLVVAQCSARRQRMCAEQLGDAFTHFTWSRSVENVVTHLTQPVERD